MRRFTKIALILAGVLGGIAVVCLLGAFALGLNSNSFVEMIHEGKFSFDEHDFDSHHAGFGHGNKYDCMEIDEVCKNLDIEIAGGNLTLAYGDVSQIQIEQNGMPKFKAYVDEHTLCVKSSSKVSINSSDAVLRITIPSDMHFNEVDLEVGASLAEIYDLNADSVSVEVGAGQVKLSNLNTLDLDAEVGMGKLEVEVVGEKTDYNYSVECGIGSVALGDASYTGISSSKVNTNIGAGRYIDVECGIGEVKVTFVE